MTILIIVLILMVIGAMPWGDYHPWGGAPSGALFVVLMVIVILVASGRL